MKTCIKKILLACALGCVCFGTAMAQESSSESKFTTSVGGDIVSSYIWRGQNLGGVSLQPSISMEYAGLSLSGWGSVGIDGNDTKEFDLTLGYGIGGFSVSITDYWFAFPGAINQYFHYGKDVTAHVFEGQIGYDFGFLALNWYTNFAGAMGSKDGKDAYSSYFSIAAPFEFGGLDWEAELGFVPWKTDFYAEVDGFSLSNVSLKASKALKISDDFDLGVYTQTVWNPTSEGAYILVGFSF
ncbi:MAG: hypothetical protein MJ197_06630 [Bacteroidales bacterium]|nr:hypothetical protein [Bacteroidales bacterium]